LLKEVLRYYREYEERNEYSHFSVEYSNKNGKSISNGLATIGFSQINDIKFVRNKILDLKKSKVNYIIDNIMFKSHVNVHSVLSNVNRVIENPVWGFSSVRERLNDLIKNTDFVYRNNHEAKLNEITKVICDGNVYVLYPSINMRNNKTKKNIVHAMIIYHCIIKDNSLKVIKVFVNDYMLKYSISRLLDTDFAAVNDIMKNYQNDFLDNIKSIKNVDNINEYHKLINVKLKESFEEFTDQDVNFENLHSLKSISFNDNLYLTIEAFNENTMSVKGEIDLLIEKIDDKPSSEFELVNKYLFKNIKQKEIKEIIRSSHFGSYTNEYPIYEKQWLAMSGLGESELLAISGPPGTGKTSFLKEIVANEFVLKTKKLIDSWNAEWEEVEIADNKIKVPPFKGKNKHSIIIASTNNKAVDNIGIELLEELCFFKDFYSDSGVNGRDINGSFAARLGRSENVQEFKKNIFDVFLEKLDKRKYEENDLLVEKFYEILKELEEFKANFSRYLELREKVDDLELDIDTLDDVVKSINEYTKKITNFEKEISECENRIEENTDKIAKLKENYNVENNKLPQIRMDIETIKMNKHEFKYRKGKIEKVSSITIIGKILTNILSLFSKKWCLEYTIGSLNSYLNKLSILQNDEKDIEESLRQFEKQQEELKEYNKNLNKKIQQCKIEINRCDQSRKLIILFEKTLREIIYEEIEINDPYRIVFQNNLIGKRHDLFELSLKLTEQYIVKNKSNIAQNLNYFFGKDGHILQNFYRTGKFFDENIKNANRYIWETMLLCFPVITTTLQSLNAYYFKMIKKLFDLLIIDEAGQVLPHFLVAPLYRMNRAVIVGDQRQLQPIPGSENPINESKLNDEQKIIYDISNGSAQGFAQKGSDFGECDSTGRIGVLLDQHRRCQKAIVQFSNKHIYESKLKLKRENKENKVFGSNLLFFDARSSSSKAKINQLEIDMIKRIVIELKQNITSNIEDKIAIISPFKNQVLSIRNQLKNLVPNIAVGTVHQFQGQEKEIIIFSSVVDESAKKGLKNFVGQKNLLNVAFTRAKDQLIVVGNIEVFKNSDVEYLEKAFNVISAEGIVVSPFDSEHDKRSRLDKKYTDRINNIITDVYKLKEPSQFKNFKYIEESENHNVLLRKLLNSNIKSLYIVSPWIRSNVVNNEFLRDLSGSLAKGLSFKVGYGYRTLRYKNNDKVFDQAYGDRVAIQQLKSLINGDLKEISPTHVKALIVNENEMLIGSHNWLSNPGTNKIDEFSYVVTNQETINYMMKRYLFKSDRS